jgi:FeS assembly SUF system regulator
VLRLSKIADYGILLLAHLARDEAAAPSNAREVAAAVELPLPVVSKILKCLARQGLIESHRGAKGGYSLKRRPEGITVAEMIGALEGQVAITECNVAPELCQHEGACSMKDPLHLINEVVEQALSTVTLADLLDPSFSPGISSLHLLGRRSESHAPGDGVPRA